MSEYHTFILKNQVYFSLLFMKLIMCNFCFQEVKHLKNIGMYQDVLQPSGFQVPYFKGTIKHVHI